MKNWVIRFGRRVINCEKLGIESCKWVTQTKTTQKQENKYEVKPQYKELSKQLIMQHAINNAMKCMKAIKDRIARPVYQLAIISVSLYTRMVYQPRKSSARDLQSPSAHHSSVSTSSHSTPWQYTSSHSNSRQSTSSNSTPWQSIPSSKAEERMTVVEAQLTMMLQQQAHMMDILKSLQSDMLSFKSPVITTGGEKIPSTDSSDGFEVKIRAVESDVEDKRSGSSYEQKNDSDVRRSCEGGIWIKCEERSDVKRSLFSSEEKSV
ncbi:hypothetical protein F511_26644 [Dorcoceras hygrometricum]|uniref:Uncharacterized protein n=1 Tax=Dorcoceras hygrometricum TaxID=472368 RepID=A0A2Z7D893_9LAMI|nr:hypothetical protein F511_26644 [Dorcoceras hygrometricum]